MLGGRDMTVQDVAVHFEMSQPAVAKHLRILSDTDLIRVEANGRSRINRLKREVENPE